MGINPLQLFWLNSLYEAGVFNNCKSILELGPQVLVFVNFDTLESVARARLQNGKDLDGFLEPLKVHFADFFKKGGVIDNIECTRHVYSLFGLKEYKSIDLFDGRADYQIDLNRRIASTLGFDVVTNFGTAEHVFNVAQVFENIHNLLRVGGVSLHVLPAYGDIGHGFYNFHPIFYEKLAQANGYQIISLVYVNDVRNFVDIFLAKSNPTPPEIKLFSKIAIDEIDREFCKNSGLRYFGSKRSNVYDYIFCAFRKLQASEFAYPSQF